MSEDRRQLAEEHTHLIRKVINQVGLRLPPYVQREELVGAAAEGLLDAAEKFDFGRGKSFSAYAEYRIRGAIFDELRRRDPMPRVLRGKVKKLERTIEELTRALGRPPEDDEVAKAMGMRLAKYHEMQVMVERASTVAYSETLSQGYVTSGSHPRVETPQSGTTAVYATPKDAATKSAGFGPLTEMLQKEQVRLLADSIAELDTRDQLILSLHYQEDLNFRQIGEILGLTESRISQLHKGALMALKDKLAKAELE